ncbi:molybdopterin molybdotransferase MoeA [Sneathiella chinensis]|uniref:Molybdopterin molybdenumtransferase n=1 Tax=Sneathiella chinensis TaxID=349750 RepID=A0ABQ5U3K1_9PROT|nr:gephyrin-like molybdotransferase Glp [Sneathiella chinensis]GLQ06245.1 molybdopterin molybdenumtransferase MoeA [Sneathiella chinensis]
MPRLPNDCFADPSEMIPFAEAREKLERAVTRITHPETCPLHNADGRLLAQDITADRNVPAGNNSAVDGYAFHFETCQAAPDRSFACSGRSAAGTPFEGTPDRTKVIKIFTGALMPEGFDTVAMLEDVTVSDGRVQLPAGLKKGVNCRLAGEDVQKGQTILKAGTRITPQIIAQLASIGRDTVPVWSRLRVAVFSTGDELREPGQQAPTGTTFDSNRYMLLSLLQRYGCKVEDRGILPDNLETITEALQQAAETSDLIITSGGVSMGDEDHVKQAVNRLGSLHFWRIAIKPGRPLALGQISGTAFVGLPGNPVASLVCATQFVRPLLAGLSGEEDSPPFPGLYGTAAFSRRKKAGRTEWLRGRYRKDPDGNCIIEPYPDEGSGIISSLVWANGLIELGPDITDIKQGDRLRFLPFSELYQ